jgi:hypothetical protein
VQRAASAAKSGDARPGGAVTHGTVRGMGVGHSRWFEIDQTPNKTRRPMCTIRARSHQ